LTRNKNGLPEQPASAQANDTTKMLFDTPTPATDKRPGLKLLDLKLRNFKGIRKFDLKADGNNLDIHGDNATGKSTLFDAYSWLLFDKDSLNQSNFEIKTLDADNNPIHGLEHEVTGCFNVNGRTTVLKKIYKEVWSTPRGQAEKVFSGHTTDHFFDGVPVPKREYEKRVAGILDEKIFRLLSDPAYFNEVLHWQKRRELLLRVCGDISDADVIQASDKLSELSGLLGDHTLDDLRAILKSRKSEIDKRKKEIPIRISENQRGLPDISGCDEESLPKDIQKARKERKAKADELARAERGGGVAEKEEQLAKIRAELWELEIAAMQQQGAVTSSKRAELRKAQDVLATNEDELRIIEGWLAIHKVDIERCMAAIEVYRKAWFEIDGQEFAFSQESVCPTCGQDLPGSQLQEAREKALEQFNLRKAKELEDINEKGKQLKEKVENAQAQVDAHKKQAEALQKRISANKRAVEKLEKEIAKVDRPADVTETAAYSELAEQRMLLEQEIESLKAGNEDVLRKLQNELDELDSVVQALEDGAKQVEQYRKGLKRIEELKAEERELSAELEEVERQLYLTDEFVRTKVTLLENKINSKFRLARFKMFEIQLNENVKETCETLVDGVPYSNLNRGAKLNVGLDIIRTLQEHYNFSCPVWIDNAEAVTKLAPMNCQVIRLVVDASAKELDVREVS